MSSGNPIETIKEMYESQVKIQDKKCDPEDFKKAAEALFDAISGSGFHVEDVRYMDGYFIFAHGTNRVVHFHITECPGWRFGIWFDNITEVNGVRSVKAEIFAQYEDSIDKFKPSASSYCEDVRVELSDHPMAFSADTILTPMLHYISSHPELAWYRDLHFVDYNTEYVSEETAKEEFIKWKAGLELDEKRGSKK